MSKNVTKMRQTLLNIATRKKVKLTKKVPKQLCPQT